MKDKLLNPTPGQVKYRNRLWAKALRANKRKAKECMYDDQGGRCCLAVAQDVATSCGLDIPSKYDDDGSPHKYVSDFFGWDNINPELVIPLKDVNGNDNENAMHLNDDWDNGTPTCGLSHKRIAECVLNTYVHPSKKKWSFKLSSL